MATQKTPFPGFEMNNPTFQSVKNLWRLAGEQDSCIQMGQISILFLENFTNTFNLNKSDFSKKLFELYHISGGNKNWEATKEKMAYSYIVQTYNLQELFFKEFNKEYIKYKSVTNWKTKKDDKNLDPYNQLIENIENEKSIKFKDTPESKIINYYRLVRNGIVHYSKASFDKPEVYYQQNIAPIKSYFDGYYKFKVDGKCPAPNLPKELNHYDFALYSRCLRYLSFLINDACDLTPKEILEVELKNTEYVKDMTFYNYVAVPALKNKLKRKLQGHFISTYGKNESHINEYSSAYFDWYENR